MCEADCRAGWGCESQSRSVVENMVRGFRLRGRRGKEGWGGGIEATEPGLDNKSFK